MHTTHTLIVFALSAATVYGAAKVNLGEPLPGEPLTVQMGQRKPARVRVARNQATLIRLPLEQRVMNVYGGDKGDGGVWAIDAGKVPTRFLAVKPREKGVRTTLHVISNTGQEISLYLEEVTGVDAQFDAEVDANEENAGSANFGPTVKWVPADEAMTCKTHADSLGVELDKTTKRAEAQLADATKEATAKAEAAVTEYQQQYPHKLFFGYDWDRGKGSHLGIESIWSDDKFTYVKGSRVLALYEINEDGKPSLIQYSYANGVYTVPKLLFDGYFAIGEKKQNKLTFHRAKG